MLNESIVMFLVCPTHTVNAMSSNKGRPASLQIGKVARARALLLVLCSIGGNMPVKGDVGGDGCNVYPLG